MLSWPDHYYVRIPHYQDSVIIVIGWTEIVSLKRIAEINDFKSATQLSHWNWLYRETLHWRHNEHDGVSNYQPHDCWLNCLYRCRWKKIFKLRVTGRWPVISPHRGPITRKMFEKFEMDYIILASFIRNWKQQPREEFATVSLHLVCNFYRRALLINRVSYLLTCLFAKMCPLVK